ncbi:MAG: family 78 glycoside hydrolase catalytic domain [Phycisphaerales bacterium]|nr:MAG: family 78 glycoside hydrolase catalytic domain [Phycisphaerales bacterium]
MSRRYVLTTLSLLSFFVTVGRADLAPTQLRCEYRIDPAGLDVTSPRLSWIVQSDERQQKQTAYRVLVASSPEQLAQNMGDLWDTGKVASDQTIHVVYRGQRLMSRGRVWWKVRLWDKDGRPSAWSRPARWTMGLLDRGDWQARWIADPSGTDNVAQDPHNGYHSEFSTQADTAKWLVLDLGPPQTIDAVRLFPARPYDYADTPGFLFPLWFKIEVADHADFADARIVVDRTAQDEPNPRTVAPVYRFAATTARFVRLTVTRLRNRDTDNFAFALAEIQVLHGDTNVARRATASALDSIETGPWALANLTDGVSTTIAPGTTPGALPATMVRKSFGLPDKVRRATAYVTALGLYELHLNGRRIGDHTLAPEWTSYRKRVQYQAYDVTELLREGDNAIGALVGEGWYAGRLMTMPRFSYGSFPRLLCQLEIELADGRTQIVATDASWRSTTTGPIRSSGIYDGEVYDARLEQTGWDEPGFDDNTWVPVDVGATHPSPVPVWQPNEPISVVKELQPIKLTEPTPGTYVFDLGQNMVGWCRIKVQGAAGQPITMRHAEMLNDNGTLYTANLRGAPQVDRYIPARGGEVVFEPHFTYHGFRFIELTGLAAPPARDAVLGRVFHSTSPDAGTFQCSDPSLTRLMQNIVWTQRGNLMSTPTDCPQRDERFGWMGDIQAFSQTAIFNMDMAAFFTKFAQDVRDDQATDGRFPDFAPHPGDPNQTFSGVPAWGDAGTIVPWRAYQNYADTRLLAQHFDAARRWVDYIRGQNPDLIWAKGRGNDYSDWLNGKWVRQSGWPNKGGAVPNEVFATAFFAHSTEIVARMAQVTGRAEEARRYRDLFERIKAAFNERFVDPNGKIEGDTQAGYALALNFDLLSETIRPKAVEHLLAGIERYHGHLSTGIQTSHRAMLELARYGHADVAWDLLTNRTFPSWLYMIDNGATTIWERWDGYVKGRGFQDPGMNSFNHWAFGAVGEWMWRHIIGLNPDEAQPGWKHSTIAPCPGGGLTWARGRYESIRGPVATAWRIEDQRLSLDVTIPPNTSATVIVPTAAPDESLAADSVAGVTFQRIQPHARVYRVDSGRYEFDAPWR